MKIKYFQRGVGYNWTKRTTAAELVSEPKIKRGLSGISHCRTSANLLLIRKDIKRYKKKKFRFTAADVLREFGKVRCTLYMQYLPRRTYRYISTWHRKIANTFRKSNFYNASKVLLDSMLNLKLQWNYERYRRKATLWVLLWKKVKIKFHLK